MATAQYNTAHDWDCIRSNRYSSRYVWGVKDSIFGGTSVSGCPGNSHNRPNSVSQPLCRAKRLSQLFPGVKPLSHIRYFKVSFFGVSEYAGEQGLLEQHWICSAASASSIAELPCAMIRVKAPQQARIRFDSFGPPTTEQHHRENGCLFQSRIRERGIRPRLAVGSDGVEWS